MAGIVQSTLITRHLLFVGFSLDDDNFQRIFDGVRKARRPPPTDTQPVPENFISTRLREQRMRDKAAKLLGPKARYPVYTNAEDDEEEEGRGRNNDVCGTALMLEYSLLKVCLLCDSMPCYAMLCYAMLCYAMLCYAMLCYAMLCYAMLCYAMLCYAMLCHAMLCYAMLYYATLCYAMLCYAMLCYAMPCALSPVSHHAARKYSIY
jgi:hypothetical protein